MEKITKKEKRYYLDTSIFIDLFENRGKNGEEAKKLFEKIIIDSSVVIYSDQHIKELKNFGYNNEEIIEMLSFIKDNLRKIHISKEDKEQAKKLASQNKVPRGDALHSILSRNNEAHLISRDEHFQKLKHITIAKKPEDITN